MKKQVILRGILICVLSLFFVTSKGGINNRKKETSCFTISTVWREGENGMDMHRIPGIVITRNGTALVFTEARPDSKDEAPKDIVLKRSIDGGLSWSENIYIERCDGSYWQKHQNEIDENDHPNKLEVWTNMTPIYDKEIGRTFLFYALSEGAVAGQNLQRYTKVFYKWSDDDGINWSERIDITNILNSNKDGEPNKDGNGNWITDSNGFPCDYLGRAFHMPGPGHGIQLNNGRLLLQCWNRKAIRVFNGGIVPRNEREYGVSTIYSDDHGETWHYGSAFGHNGQNLNESRILELENGDVYLNGRYTSNKRNNHRITAISHDQGVTWTDISIDESFPLSNACDGGLARLTSSDEGKSRLLYSKNESTEGRKNLVIKLSYDEAITWPVSTVVDSGDAWYSDIAILPDKTVLVVYETGKEVKCARISFERLTDSEDGE